MPSHSLQPEMLLRANALITQLQVLQKRAEGAATDIFTNSLDCALSLRGMIEAKAIIFGHEQWHNLQEQTNNASELLLRVKSDDGDAFQPYPFVMTCYENGLTLDLDALLILAALSHYDAVSRGTADNRIAVNVSAKFFEQRNRKNIMHLVQCLDDMNFQSDEGEGLILEIHESSSDVSIDPETLNMFRKKGVKFAMDDVVMAPSDVMRFSGFKNYTDFVKLDRHFLQDHEVDTVFFAGMIDFLRTNAPESRIIAEGVKDADHARRLHDMYKHIEFVQGRHLPDRDIFKKEWGNVKTQNDPA